MEERDNYKEIEIDRKISDKFPWKFRRNLFQIEGFMTDNSFYESVEDNSRDAHHGP